jgi:hypothetical protein
MSIEKQKSEKKIYQPAVIPGYSMQSDFTFSLKIIIVAFVKPISIMMVVVVVLIVILWTWVQHF